jgi:hypothetical protein
VLRILPQFILKREEASHALAILQAATEHAERTVSAGAVDGTGWMK